jgi:hypothetical protein
MWCYVSVHKRGFYAIVDGIMEVDVMAQLPMG